MLNSENIFIVNIIDLSVFNDQEDALKLEVIHNYNGNYGITTELLNNQIIKCDLSQFVTSYVKRLINEAEISLESEYDFAREEQYFTDDTLRIRKEFNTCGLIINIKGIYEELKHLKDSLVPYTYKKVVE